MARLTSGWDRVGTVLAVTLFAQVVMYAGPAAGRQVSHCFGPRLEYDGPTPASRSVVISHPHPNSEWVVEGDGRIAWGNCSHPDWVATLTLLRNVRVAGVDRVDRVLSIPGATSGAESLVWSPVFGASGSTDFPGSGGRYRVSVTISDGTPAHAHTDTTGFFWILRDPAVTLTLTDPADRTRVVVPNRSGASEQVVSGETYRINFGLSGEARTGPDARYRLLLTHEQGGDYEDEIEASFSATPYVISEGEPYLWTVPLSSDAQPLPVSPFYYVRLERVDLRPEPGSPQEDTIIWNRHGARTAAFSIDHRRDWRERIYVTVAVVLLVLLGGYVGYRTLVTPFGSRAALDN